MTAVRDRAQPGRVAARRRRALLTVAIVAWLAAPAAAADASRERLTEEDLQYSNAARQRALETEPSRTPTYWSNAASGNAGVVTPLKTYRTSTGYFCRVYRERTIVGAVEVSTTTATACRDDGGTWRILREE